MIDRWLEMRRKRWNFHPNGTSVLWVLVLVLSLGVGSALFLYWSTKGQTTRIPAEALSKIEQEKAKAQKDFQDFIKTPAGKIWETHPYWDRDICEKVAGGELIPGMSKEQAREALKVAGKVKRKIPIGKTDEEWFAESQGEIRLRFEGNVLKTVDRK